MAFTLEETPDSRRETASPPTYELVYNATGEHDNDVVYANALAATPSVVFRTFGTLVRQDLELDPVGWAHYLVTVPYGLPGSNPRNLPQGTIHFDFDSTGATVNIKVAKEHINSFPANPSSENPHKGAIGVNEDGDVEGADIVIPALKLSYSFKHASGVVDEIFARTLARVTGTTNKFAFRGFQAEELLFLGASGSDGSDAEAAVTYNFLASENVDDLTIGDVTSIVKKGHHYAWIEFKDEVEDGQPVRQPRRVHIERVYDPIDFANTFGWGWS